MRRESHRENVYKSFHVYLYSELLRMIKKTMIIGTKSIDTNEVMKHPVRNPIKPRVFGFLNTAIHTCPLASSFLFTLPCSPGQWSTQNRNKFISKRSFALGTIGLSLQTIPLIIASFRRENHAKGTGFIMSPETLRTAVGPLAQLAERGANNAKVMGSSPIRTMVLFLFLSLLPVDFLLLGF